MSFQEGQYPKKDSLGSSFLSIYESPRLSSDDQAFAFRTDVSKTLGIDSVANRLPFEAGLVSGTISTGR